MFLPFLPHLLALAGIAALLGLDSAAAAPPADGPAVALLYVALPLLGLLVGHVPERWLGPYRMNTLSRRRLVVLGVWLWALAASPLPQTLAARFAALGAGQEIAIGLLAVNFWLSDALALYPYNPLAVGTLRAQAARLGRTLRLPLPILVLMGAGLALPVLLGSGPATWLASAPGMRWLEPLAVLVSMLVVAAVAIPTLIRVCWGLRPLATPDAARVIEDELAANGVSVARVLAWPEHMMGMATAGVIGLLPRFRYLLMSDSLARALTPEELRSVTAHEAAHLKHRHLWFFLIAIFSFILLMQVVMTGLFWLGLLGGADLPLWLYVVLEVAALLAFLRVGVGYLSRHFERQADGHALRRQGLDAFFGALHKVGAINGIPPDQDNWHHYGISQRVGFLNAALRAPDTLGRHDHKVRRIKLALLALLVLALGAQAGASSPLATRLLTRHYLAARVERMEEPSRADLQVLRYLAHNALQNEQPAAAERYFRLILTVTPQDPQTQNNLAWILVTRASANREALREGLRLARQASQGSRSAYIWDTLAEAYYRLGRLEQAVTAADRALQLAEAGEGRGDAPLEYYRERVQSFRQHRQGA